MCMLRNTYTHAHPHVHAHSIFFYIQFLGQHPLPQKLRRPKSSGSQANSRAQVLFHLTHPAY